MRLDAVDALGLVARAAFWACAEAGRAQASDAKMRGALEQRRAALLKAQADTARGERERKLAVRYHKVKFFGACPRRCASTGGCFRRLGLSVC
jgi:hypothetical protein